MEIRPINETISARATIVIRFLSILTLFPFTNWNPSTTSPIPAIAIFVFISGRKDGSKGKKYKLVIMRIMIVDIMFFIV